MTGIDIFFVMYLQWVIDLTIRDVFVVGNTPLMYLQWAVYRRFICNWLYSSMIIMHLLWGIRSYDP